MSFPYALDGNTPLSTASTPPVAGAGASAGTPGGSLDLSLSNSGSPPGTSAGGSFIPDATAQSPTSEAAKSTLWMGELDPWLDELAIKKIWSVYGENVSVKLIRDKFSGSHSGYCFVEFANVAAATKALGLNGQAIPNSQRVFKLNWASGGGLLDKRDDRGPEFSIFVGDLAPDVSEFALHQLFHLRYPSCKSAKVMTDPVTSTSRGYGFVRFSDEGEMQRALSEMQGVYCGSRPMRISTATPKNKGGPNGGSVSPGSNQQGMYQVPPNAPYYGSQGVNQFTDPNNTTVFVGGLSGYVSEDELRSYFNNFGEITYVKIPPGKGCGFVQFVTRQSAEAAITQMQGYPIGNSRVRLSWGRSQTSMGVPGGPGGPIPGVPGGHQNNMNNINAFHRSAPPPHNVYGQMGMAPGQPPFGSYGPMSAMQPGQMPVQVSLQNMGRQQGVAPAPPGPPGPPGQPQQQQQAQQAQQPQQPLAGQETSEPIPVARLNELYLAAREGRLDRVESEGRGYGVYAQ